jgi:pre-mRNA-splicing factor 18
MGADLDARSDLEKRSIEGQMDTVTYRQLREHLKPLVKMLRKGTVPGDVMERIHEIAQFLVAREYLSANSTYVRMSIGNAAWPMGVTMVGIHERSGREKIFEQNVAHVLNDETQRKYIQAIKRLMTFCQRKYPTDPSKSVG